MTREEESDEMCPVIVAYDNQKYDVWALPIEKKGAVEAAVQWMVAKMDLAGYRGMPVTLKSDGEPAIIALKNAVAVKREARPRLHL